MKFRYGVDSSTLHVRCSNRGAQRLYLHSLGYRVVETVKKYYQVRAARTLKMRSRGPQRPQGFDPASVVLFRKTVSRSLAHPLLTISSCPPHFPGWG